METVSQQGLTSSHRVIGLDIHPDTFTAAIVDASTDRLISSSSQIPMQRLKGWVSKHHEPGDLFVVEAGSNSFATVEQIRSCGALAIVLESFRAGQISKAYLKNDQIDAEKVARIYLSGLAHEVWVPDDRTRVRREMLAAYRNAVKDSTRNTLRLKSWLCGQGVRLRKGQSLTNKSTKQKLLENPRWDDGQRLLIETYLEKIEQARVARKRLNQYMAVEVSNDPAMMKLLRLYGVRTVNAFAISAIVGDISRFRTPKQLVAYVGLQPKVTQSGNTKRTSVTIGFGRRDLRAYILQSAHAILRMGPNTHPVAKWGQQKARQKGWNVAAVAVARKLVVAIWYLMRGFYTNLEEVSPMIRLHLRKMGNTIGAKARREMGYRTVEDFVIQKELILLDTT